MYTLLVTKRFQIKLLQHMSKLLDGLMMRREEKT